MKFKTGILFSIFIFGLPLIAQAENVSQSTIDDQASVEVTVYHSNSGLIKDVRKLHLSDNQGELRFMDVAADIIPETVHIKDLSGKGKFAVLEQNYEYDLMSPSKLLDKYVGKKIKLMEYNPYQGKKDFVSAELLSNNNSQPIYKIDNEIYLGHPAGSYQILPEIPENLIAKPTLMWLYDGGNSVDSVEVSY